MASQRLPSSIKVGSLVYEVQHDQAALDARCRDAGSDLLGYCSTRDLQIGVALNQALGQRRAALIHEWLHALMEQIGLREEWGEAKEEKVVARITPALLDGLRSNPDLLRYLLAD